MKTIEVEMVEENQAVVLSEIKYPVSKIDLETLLKEYKDIPDINPDADEELVGKQYQFVLKGHKAFVKARTGIEKTRKLLKQPALDYGKQVDGIAKEFQSMIVDAETKLQIQRKKVEDNEARKQREIEEAEELRVDTIKNKILNIKNLPLNHFNSDSQTLTNALETLRTITVEEYEEFTEEASDAQEKVIQQLQQARETKVKAEQADKIEAQRLEEANKIEAQRLEAQKVEQQKLEAERAEFERQKQEFARQQREQQEAIDRQNAEREAIELQKKQEAERVEREKQQALERQQREQQDIELLEKRKIETLGKFYNCGTYEVLLDAIIDGRVPNIKWVQDGN